MGERWLGYWRIGLPLAWLLFGSTAHGAPSRPLHMEYNVFAGCPSREDFFSQVQSRTSLARQANPLEKASTYAITVEREENQVRGRLEVHDPEQPTMVRDFFGKDCSEVTDALALIVALSLDPVEAPISPVSSVSPPQESEPRKLQIVLGVAGMGMTLPTEGLAYGPIAFADFAWISSRVARSSIRLSFTYLAHDEVPLGPASARFSYLGGRFEGCPIGVRMTDSVLWSPCFGLDLGLLRGEGLNVATPKQSRDLWMAPLLNSHLAFRIVDAWTLELQVGGIAPIVRRTFVFESPHTETRKVPSLGYFLAGGLSFAFL